MLGARNWINLNGVHGCSNIAAIIFCGGRRFSLAEREREVKVWLGAFSANWQIRGAADVGLWVVFFRLR
jgi:hypothetical protein